MDNGFDQALDFHRGLLLMNCGIHEWAAKKSIVKKQKAAG